MTDRETLPPDKWWQKAETIESENGHHWIMDWRGKYQLCRTCGRIRRADKTSSPCSGPAKVVLR